MTLNHQKCQCHAGVSVCVSIGTAGGGATVHSESKLRLNGSRAMSGPVPACSTKRPPPPPPSLPSSGGGGGLERSVPQERGQGEGGEIKSRKREEGMVAAGCKQAAGFSPLLAFLLPPTVLHCSPPFRLSRGGVGGLCHKLPKPKSRMPFNASSSSSLNMWSVRARCGAAA